jgi:hypothetical protein
MTIKLHLILLKFDWLRLKSSQTLNNKKYTILK